MKMPANLAWNKLNGLLPAIIQDAETSNVLMLGYMNQEALEKTIETKYITFFSRSKNRLWIKGETSGHKLKLVNIFPDCDNDALLIHVNPIGPTCHNNTQSCFADNNKTDWEFLQSLIVLIEKRAQLRLDNSYTSSLFNAGINKIAQKVGEEAIEVILSSTENDDKAFCAEMADLFFHTFVLLIAKNLKLTNVINVLRERMNK